MNCNKLKIEFEEFEKELESFKAVLISKDVAEAKNCRDKIVCMVERWDFISFFKLQQYIKKNFPEYIKRRISVITFELRNLKMEKGDNWDKLHGHIQNMKSIGLSDREEICEAEIVVPGDNSFGVEVTFFYQPGNKNKFAVEFGRKDGFSKGRYASVEQAVQKFLDEYLNANG